MNTSLLYPPARVALLLMALCFGSAVAHAQTASDPPLLFEEVTTSSSSTTLSGDLSQLSHSDLTQRVPALQGVTEQQFKALKEVPGAQGVRLVRIPIRKKLDGLTAITANVGGKKFVAALDRVDVISDEEYAWEGTIREKGIEFGTVVLVNKKGKIAGIVRTYDRLYEISALKKDLYAVTEVDPAKAPPESEQDYVVEASSTDAEEAEAAPELNGGFPSGPDDFAQSTAASGPTPRETQRVLILYNDDVADAVSDISGRASLAIQKANEAYSRSGISGYLRLEMAALRWIDFETTSTPRNDVRNLADNPQAQALRNQYDADMVVLLTNTARYGSTRGIARDIHPSASNAYAIVQVATIAYEVFSHEVGHLQSAQHHPRDLLVPGKPYPYGRGHRFSTPVKLFGVTVDREFRATVMAYHRENSRDQYHYRLPNFSNPNIARLWPF